MRLLNNFYGWLFRPVDPFAGRFRRRKAVTPDICQRRCGEASDARTALISSPPANCPMGSHCGWASPQPGSGGRARCLLPVLGLLAVLSGCATPEQTRVVTNRKFDFQKDTFAYSNDLIWEYYFDEKGDWVHRRRQPRPDYTHHCFVVARTARQFFLNARFDPTQPVADEDTYRRLI